MLLSCPSENYSAMTRIHRTKGRRTRQWVKQACPTNNGDDDYVSQFCKLPFLLQAIAKWCKENEIDIVVVGPEDPLADGIVDKLSSLGVKCFGPTQAGARIEADKDWSKTFMNKYQIPTARHKSFTDAAAAKEFIKT